MDTFVRVTPYTGRIRAVILDWAGTAVDYGSFAPTTVFVRLFEKHGVQITERDARSGMGLMKKDHLKTLFSIPSVIQAWKSANGAPATEADVETLYQEFVPQQLAVLKDYSRPIPGLMETMKYIKERGMKVGSTTGYIRSMMDVLAPEAARHGYRPDLIVCPDEVPAGRPYPWMCFQNAIQLGVYPMEALVKVGDSLPDVEEGLNAGMWTVGLTLTGNMLGMHKKEVDALSIKERRDTSERIAGQFYQAGAHFVADGIWDLPLVLEEIQSRLAQGDRP